MPNKAPANWKEKNFEQAIKKVTYTNKILKKDFMTTGVFPIISQEEEYISGYWNDKKDVYKINKPVVIFGDHTKVIKYVNFDFVLGADGVKIFETIDEILPKYLYYYLKNTQLRNLGYARHYKLLKEKYIMYPSLSEQEQIVRILDEAFENIEKAKQNTLQNLNNAKELFENSLNDIFIKNMKNWNVNSIEQIVSKEKYSIKRGPFGSSLKKSCFVDTGIRVFEQYNPINNDPYWARYYITKEKYDELKAFTAGPGDLLISCSGVTLGRIVELPEDTEIGIINQALLKIKLDNTKILNKFFVYLFRSKQFQNKIFEYSQGVAIPNMVGVTELKKILIFYPNIQEQQCIIDKLDKLQQQSQKLEQIYNQKLKSLEELKQSILQKAFNGEL